MQVVPTSPKVYLIFNHILIMVITSGGKLYQLVASCKPSRGSLPESTLKTGMDGAGPASRYNTRGTGHNHSGLQVIEILAFFCEILNTDQL